MVVFQNIKCLGCGYIFRTDEGARAHFILSGHWRAEYQQEDGRWVEG